MRKTASVVIAAITLVILTACAGGKPAPSGSATEIADKIFAQAQVEPFGPYEGLEDDMAKEFYLGSKDYPRFADAVAVVPMISIDTRVLVVIKAADKGNVKEIETKLEQNIDPNKVVCVTFTLEDVAIESRGDVVFLTINTDAAQRESLVEAFRDIE
jgi:hypothetical protein